MSAVCRIIHLHGGPSDGLRLPWDGGLSEMDVLPAAPSASDSEYDYVYLPRVARTARRHLAIELLIKPKSSPWQRVWQAFATWMLTPCSYPLDLRAYQPRSIADQSSANQQ